MKIINKLYLQIIKKPKNKWLIILYLWLFGLPLLAKRLRYKFTKELLPNKIRGKRILDVGCTIGDFALILAEKGANVVGVDLKNRMRQAQKIAKIHQLKAKFIASDVNKLEYHYYFDGIIALDIIEHIQNDSKFIKKLNSMLRQSGFLILSVPSIYREIVEKREKEIGHVRTGYSKSQMTKLLTPLGFKINDLFYVDTQDKIHSFYTTRSQLKRLIIFPFLYLIARKKATKNEKGAILFCQATKK